MRTQVVAVLLAFSACAIGRVSCGDDRVDGGGEPKRWLPPFVESAVVDHTSAYISAYVPPRRGMRLTGFADGVAFFSHPDFNFEVRGPQVLPYGVDHACPFHLWSVLGWRKPRVVDGHVLTGVQVYEYGVSVESTSSPTVFSPPKPGEKHTRTCRIGVQVRGRHNECPMWIVYESDGVIDLHRRSDVPDRSQQAPIRGGRRSDRSPRHQGGTGTG